VKHSVSLPKDFKVLLYCCYTQPFYLTEDPLFCVILIYAWCIIFNVFLGRQYLQVTHRHCPLLKLPASLKGRIGLEAYTSSILSLSWSLLRLFVVTIPARRHLMHYSCLPITFRSNLSHARCLHFHNPFYTVILQNWFSISGPAILQNLPGNQYYYFIKTIPIISFY